MVRELIYVNAPNVNVLYFMPFSVDRLLREERVPSVTGCDDSNSCNETRVQANLTKLYLFRSGHKHLGF